MNIISLEEKVRPAVSTYLVSHDAGHILLLVLVISMFVPFLTDQFYCELIQMDMKSL